MNLLLMNEQGNKVYREAIDNYASHMLRGAVPVHSIFIVSEILSISFGIMKEKTFSDLIDAQQKLGG